MKIWVTQWHPDMDDEESVLAQTPEDLWVTVHVMLRDYPDEHITIVPAD